MNFACLAAAVTEYIHGLGSINSLATKGKLDTVCASCHWLVAHPLSLLYTRFCSSLQNHSDDLS